MVVHLETEYVIIISFFLYYIYSAPSPLTCWNLLHLLFFPVGVGSGPSPGTPCSCSALSTWRHRLAVRAGMAMSPKPRMEKRAGRRNSGQQWSICVPCSVKTPPTPRMYGRLGVAMFNKKKSKRKRRTLPCFKKDQSIRGLFELLCGFPNSQEALRVPMGMPNQQCWHRLGTASHCWGGNHKKKWFSQIHIPVAQLSPILP